MSRLLPVRIPPDILLPVAVAFILGMLIIPLPSVLLDVALAANMGLASLVLVSVMMAPRALSLSSFPVLLLISTLFRLALNVSTTRMILSTGSAGEVVQAFGSFVLRGDVAVGLVVFLVLTLVQFMVIAKGSERVAEVGARFTLDAMPGKQMSIDADLRGGGIDDAEARRLRSELGRESQFYGSMDGAMKFVKGDAIAGLVITAINLIAGLAIGIVRDGLPGAVAIDIYSTLTVGDGLVSQIPSLLISIAAGILTTRVAAPNEAEDLGRRLELELFSSTKPLAVGAAFCAVLGLIPGLPVVPFLVIALVLGGLSWWRRPKLSVEDHEPESVEAVVSARVEQQKKQRTAVDDMAPSVSLLSVELSPMLSRAFGFGKSQDEQTELLASLIPQLREAVFLDSGVRLPGIRIRTHSPTLSDHEFRVLVKEVVVHQHEVRPDVTFVVARPSRMKRLGEQDVEEVGHPSNGVPCCFLPGDRMAQLQELGIQSWSAQGYIALVVMAQAKEHLAEFVGVQEVGDIIEQMRKVYPTLVEETIPRILRLPQLVEVVRHLVRERISVRDMRSILDAIAASADRAPDELVLTEWVRDSLRRQIAQGITGRSSRLGVIVVRPEVEAFLEDSVVHSASGRHLVMEPELRVRFLKSVGAAVEPALRSTGKAVLLTRGGVRADLRRLLEPYFPFAHVLSHDDIPASLELHPLGVLGLD